jgi:hypothetical protein
MSEYLVLIYEDEAGYASMDEKTWNQMGDAHRTFMANNQAVLRGGNALQQTSTATAIRTSVAGEATVTDGPFAETKEALGGYYLIEAPDLDAAIAIAKQVPAPLGGVEVRPVMIFE